MKIAGYIHPIAQALGPNFACGWFEIVAKLLQALHRDADCECMMIAGSWPFRWAAEKGRGLMVRMAFASSAAGYLRKSWSASCSVRLGQSGSTKLPSRPWTFGGAVTRRPLLRGTVSFVDDG